MAGKTTKKKAAKQAEGDAVIEAGDAPEPMHLKRPGGTLACGESPHGILATMTLAKTTCEPCKTEERERLAQEEREERAGES